ncbi:MAG: hypothetical protein HZA50_06750 [Planctomycetes bacterium]|nr:hypothetical protein [Planctomycetota bacterium]
MPITDLHILNYLHDARVLHVTYCTEQSDDRSMVLSVICHPDSGYPVWDGKHLSIRLEAVFMLSFFVFGAVIGEETIDSWHPVISESMESEIQRHQKLGYDCSGTRFTLSFHSGSFIEGLCRQIIVEEFVNI